MAVKRRPAPSVDTAAAAAFVAAADAPETRPSALPPLVVRRPAPDPDEPLPTTMLLRFREPYDEARAVAELAAHLDRSKHWVAWTALVRGLEIMRAEAGIR